MNARPKTSSTLARIEPMSAAWTTPTRPARRAKIPKNSSGRLPSADWTTPVIPEPRRSPSRSTLRPTIVARTPSAAAETTNGKTDPVWV